MKPVQPGYLRKSAPEPHWSARDVEIVRKARALWAFGEGTHTPRWLLDWIHFIAWYEHLYGEAETRERILYDLARTGRRQAGGS